MNVSQNLTNVNYNSRGTNPSWIVIHNTANSTSAAGTAYNNTCYFKSTNRNASAHYFVDDGDTIWQCVRDTDTAWHVGDSYSHNGATNYNAIGIEVCERADGTFSAKEIETLTELVQYLMDKYDIPASRVCRHYDVTTKNCPRYYAQNSSAWESLKEQITEGDNMIPSEVYDYRIWDGDTWGTGGEGSGDGYASTGNLIAYTYLNSVKTAKKVENLQTPEIDYDKLADKVAGKINAVDYDKLAEVVADVLAKRMAE